MRPLLPSVSPRPRTVQRRPSHTLGKQRSRQCLLANLLCGLGEGVQSLQLVGEAKEAAKAGRFRVLSTVLTGFSLPCVYWLFAPPIPFPIFQYLFTSAAVHTCPLASSPQPYFPYPLLFNVSYPSLFFLFSIPPADKTHLKKIVE